MKLLFTIIVAAILIAKSCLIAQTYDSPLQPLRDHARSSFGFVIGVGQNFQTGNYRVECPGCIFEDGVGAGWDIGLNYQYFLDEKIYFNFLVMFNNMGIENRIFEVVDHKFYSNVTEHEESMPIQLRHKAKTEFNYLSLVPGIKYQPSKWLFFNLGVMASYITSNNVTHKLELVERRIVFSKTGEVFNLSVSNFANETEIEVENGNFPELNKFQLGLFPQIGVPISLGQYHRITPIFAYYVPLTKVSDYGEDFKLNSWRVMFEYRIFFRSY